jgi:hypothetical protein
MNLKSKTIYTEKISDIAGENSALTLKHRFYIFAHKSCHLIKILLPIVSETPTALSTKYGGPIGSSFKAVKEFLSFNNTSVFNRYRFINYDISDYTRKKIKIKNKREY